jgi:hypothetical protein
MLMVVMRYAFCNACFQIEGKLMFATIILDRYTKYEAADVADALTEICSPDDAMGWSSSGIYCFWDEYSGECLYLGMTNDLSRRFKEHNGLLPVLASAGTKSKKIGEYFYNHQTIGLGIFVKSPLGQPPVAGAGNYFSAISEDACQELKLQERSEISFVEGALIEAYRSKNGNFPSWNDCGGSIAGQKSGVRPDTYDCLISGLTAEVSIKTHNFVAKRSIRKLAQDSTSFLFEENLHAVRVMIMYFGMSFNEAFMSLSENEKRLGGNAFKRMQASNYLCERLEMRKR